MINYTEHNKLAMPDLNSPAAIRVISEIINNIDDGLSKFYVATSNTKNLYNITTGINKTELKNGYSIKIGIPSDSDNNVTVSVDNIVIPVKKPNGNPVKNFKANGVYSLTYYNGSFILVSGADESDTTNVGIDGSKVLIGTTFVGSDGEVHNGTMPNNGTLETTLTTHGATYNIPSGYTSGGQVKTNITNCTAENIKYNVSVGGVTGSFTSDGTIDASKVVKDYVGYSKGSRIVGTATIQSLGGTDCKEIIVPAHPDGYVNKISLDSVGYKPSIIFMEYVGGGDYVDSYVWLKNYGSINSSFVSIAASSNGNLDVFERKYVFYDYTSDTNQYIMFQYETSYPLRVKCYK